MAMKQIGTKRAAIEGTEQPIRLEEIVPKASKHFTSVRGQKVPAVAPTVVNRQRPVPATHLSAGPEQLMVIDDGSNAASIIQGTSLQPMVC